MFGQEAWTRYEFISLMLTVQILKITDLFLRKLSSQENAEKCRNLEMQACCRHFSYQSLNKRKVKCKQTEENYRIFHSIAANEEFCRFFTELCRLMRNFAENADNFFSASALLC